ncbi:MAG: MscL family protein [Acidobacteriota bacterium]
MFSKIHEFIDFVREQGVVGLAIGFILGGSARNLVSALVDDILDPFLGLLLLHRTENLAQAKFVIGSAEFLWGDFLTKLIDFLLLALVVYIVFRSLKLEEMLDKKKK